MTDRIHMPHTIAIRDSGGVTANDYKLVFSGDVEPEFVEKHGATPSPDAQIYETNNGDWAVVDSVWGGTDAWTYGGQKVRMAFDDPERVEIQINDTGWKPATDFDATESLDSGSSGGSSGGPSGGSSNGSSSGSPNSTPAPDDVSLSNPDKDEAIGCGAWHEIPDSEADPQRGIVSRYEQTAGDVDLHVDENDDGALQQIHNLLPKEFLHEVSIQPSDGYHAGNGSAIHTGVQRVKPGGLYELAGGGAENCKSHSGINGTFLGKQVYIQLRDIHFTNLSQFCGPVDIRGCWFEGFDKDGANADSTSAISGKNARAHMKNCRIGLGDDDYSIHSTLMEQYAIFGSEFNATQRAIRQPEGSIVTIGWGNECKAPKFSAHHDDMQRATYRGGERQ